MTSTSKFTNRSTNALDLTNWRFTSGIDYTFPLPIHCSHERLPRIARSPRVAAFLITNYGNLNIELPYGPFSGRLCTAANVRLGIPYYYFVTNGADSGQTSPKLCK